MPAPPHNKKYCATMVLRIQWSLRIRTLWEQSFCPLFGGCPLVGGSNHYSKHQSIIPIGAVASFLYIEVVFWWEGPL